ncbi:MAG TPA: S8 family serine peptidase [Gemmatimonadaceae bacterium]|nr:S8 family serine peptidase [Gemmatimonadaceae bacterium]
MLTAPREWQLLDDSINHVPGISARRAETVLLAGKQPKRTVLVAVIDGGVDTAQADLKANLWTNAKEIPGNGKDDDGDGYVDDVYGWNFLGNPDGRDVHYERLEVTRLTADCQAAEHGATDSVPPTERGQCSTITADYQKQKAEAQQQLQQMRLIDAVYDRLRQALGTDSLTTERVTALQPTTPDVQQARAIYLRLIAQGISPSDVTEAKKELETRVTYNLDLTYNPRPIVGDDPTNVTQHIYGNADVMGPDALHGTHVSGIIAALRGNGLGIDGIAPDVRVLMVRAVPDGDERDKDVANAIRYAVDRGANIISMSFGKPYSPEKAAVDAAVKYADAHGVLMVHAAGNDGKDLDSTANGNFPTRNYLGGGSAQNWIEVGASSWKGGDSLAASFSNYGHQQVDVFAPGVDVLSTVPGGYRRESGTSMAAPMVSGVAALLMSYYPTLTAQQVKHIILSSATSYAADTVTQPGSQNGAQVPFGSLSVTGGIVNAYAAIRMAEQMSGGKAQGAQPQ